MVEIVLGRFLERYHVAGVKKHDRYEVVVSWSRWAQKKYMTVQGNLIDQRYVDHFYIQRMFHLLSIFVET